MPSGQFKHKLVAKDLEAMTGECQACGPVRLANRSAPRPGGKRSVCCWNAKKAARQAQSPAAWMYHTPKAHGLTVMEARAYLVGKVCALCGSDERLAVDHDHGTGKIRDALCRRHNLGMGMFGDDPVLLRAAADYIERHRA